MSSPESSGEAKRLRALYRYGILDTPPEPQFDDITRIVAIVCAAPTAVITLVDSERQWFKSCYGLDVNETPRSVAFCAHTIQQTGLFEIKDATQDFRFRNNPLVVKTPKIRFYAGVPLVTPDGYAIGALAVVDYKPRSLSAEQQYFLEVMARQIADLFELRRFISSQAARIDDQQTIHDAEVTAALDAIVTINKDGIVTEFNPAAEKLFGYAKQDAIGTLLSELIVPPSFREQHNRGMKHYIETGEGPVLHRRIEITAMHKTGHEFPVELAITPIHLDNGEVMFSGYMRDITERKTHAEEIHRLAYEDALTGLANRSALRRALETAILASKQPDQCFALILINIDNFRDINNSLGHFNGDVLLNNVASRLKNAVWDTDMVARTGGDDFVVLLPHLNNKNDIGMVADKISVALNDTFVIADIPLNIEATLGAAIYPDHGDSAQLLWQHADVALREAKSRHEKYLLYKKQFDCYDPQKLALLGELRRAIQNDQLELYYQPQIDLRRNSMVGIEALVRWNHPQRGLVMPDDFIPLAERTGLIDQVTLWILSRAFQQLVELDALFPNLGLSINISSRNLQNPGLTREMSNLLEVSGFEPWRITLEVTETAIMKDPATAKKRLNQLFNMGLMLSIDDFGMGHSSLAYLKDLPVSKMKIDKSFVMALDDSHNAKIVKAAIELGHNLGLSVTAEGIEDAASLETIRAYGGDIGQGYYFAKPLSLAELQHWGSQSPWGRMQN